jgi:hypothetical protein
MAVLVAPTTAENEPGLGPIARLAGVTTVGVTGMVCTLPPELQTMLSLFGPAVAALNVYTYAQGTLAATVPVQVVVVKSAVRSGPLARQDRSVIACVAVTVTEIEAL